MSACLLRYARVLFVVVLGAIGCVPAAQAAPVFTDAGFERQKLVGSGSGGVARPTTVAFAPDGRMFIADDRGPRANGGKPAEVRVLNPGSSTTTIVNYDMATQVSEAQDRGFTGLAVDKDFASNGFLYLLFTYEHDQNAAHADWVKTQRLVRIKVGPDNKYVAGSATVILGTYGRPGSPMGTPYVDGLPATRGGTGKACPPPAPSVDCIPSDGNEHSVDSVRVDPNDGTLWVSVGDGGAGGDAMDPVSTRSMDVNSLAGKLLHVDRNGNGLPGNPFCPAGASLSETRCKVHSIGYRNPFRFSIRPNLGQPIDGMPVVGDVGWNTKEEVDLARPGQNYGWPCFEGTIKTPSWSGQPFCTNAYSTGGPTGSFAGPVWEYGYSAEGAAIIGGPTYDGDGDGAGSADVYDPATDYPIGYRGDTIISDYVSSTATRVRLTSTGGLASTTPFASQVYDAVDWVEHPSGDLVYVNINFTGIEEPAVYRIRYAPQNRAPTAVAKATTASQTTPTDVAYGPSPLTVSFTSAGSSDPDGQTLSYKWDFGDGTSSTAANPTKQYTGTVNKTATLTVTDSGGRSATDTVLVSPGNRPPVASITSAPSWRSGEQVTVGGSVTDPDGGTPTTTWDVKLKHNTHFHDAGSSPTFIADPARDHPVDAAYEVRLTATDARGLSHTTIATLSPQTAPLRIESTPSGAPVTMGGTGGLTAPYATNATIGSQPSISAASTFVSNGVTYTFSKWSDGVLTPSRSVTVSPTGVTATAQYTSSTTPPPPAGTLHVTQSGSGTTCSSASPCSLASAVGKANATPSTLDTIQIAGAFSSTAPVDLRTSPIRLIGSGSGTGGTAITVNGAVAAYAGGGSSIEKVRLAGTEPRVVELQEGAKLADAVVARSGTWAAAVAVNATSSTAQTLLQRVRIEQPNNGEGTGLIDRFPTAGASLEDTVVEDSVITGAAYGIAWRTGRLVVRRSTIEAEENGLMLDRVGVASTSVPLDVHASSTVIRATPTIGDVTTGYFNALRLRDGVSVTARHLVLDGSANTGVSGNQSLRDGVDIGGTSTATSKLDIRHSVLYLVNSFVCSQYGRVDVATTAHNTSSPASATCAVVDGGGNTAAWDLGFVNPGAGDFRLLPSSRLIDAAGTTAISAFESPTDRAGAARILDGDGNGTAQRDLGAYEHVKSGDTTAPAAPAITSPAEGSWSKSSTITLSGTAEPASTVTVFASAAVKATAVASSGGAWSAQVTGVADGTHVYTATARDAAGNVSSASAGRTVRVDTVVPVITWAADAPVGTITTRSPSFSYTSSSSTDFLQCRLDGPGTAIGPVVGPCPSPRSFSGLVDGDYVFRVRATDLAGNIKDSSRVFTVAGSTAARSASRSAPLPEGSVAPPPVAAPAPAPATPISLPGAGTSLRGGADRIAVPVRCAASATRACTAEVHLELLDRRGRRILVAARRSVRVPAGGTVRVTLRLTGAAKRALRGRRSAPARLVLAQGRKTLASRRMTVRRSAGRLSLSPR